ncbi:MAG: hypothetical protein ACOY82_08770 [Pseudomonadota bacterium]
MIAGRNDSNERSKRASPDARPKPPPLPRIESAPPRSQAPTKRTIGVLLLLAEVVQLELLVWGWRNLDSVYRWKDWEHFGHVVGLTFGVVGLFWVIALIFVAVVFVLSATAAAALTVSFLIHLLASNQKRKTQAALFACAGFPAGTIVGVYALFALGFFSNRSQSPPVLEQRA